MPSLSSGQNASLVLAPGESYTISSTGGATVKGIYGAPSNTTTLAANFAKFGPYGVPAKLDIACQSGTANYALDQFVGVPVTAQTDPVTGRIGLSGIAFTNAVTAINDMSVSAAVSNRVIIQSLLDAGGEVKLPSGITYIDKTVSVKSNTHITGPKDARLEIVSGNQPSGYSVASLTSVGVFATIAFSSSVPAGFVGTTKKMGIGGASPVGYNGQYDVTFTSATTATYSLVASVSNVSASAQATINATGTIPGALWVGGPFEEYGYVSNIIRNKNWASSRHTLTAFTIGSQTIIGNTPITFSVSGSPTWAAGGFIRMWGDTTKAWVGIFEIVSFVAGVVTLYYKGPSSRVPAPTGTLYAQEADSNITISRVIVSGGMRRGCADASWNSHGILFNNVMNPYFDDIKVIDVGKYGIALSNTVDSVGDVYFDTGSDGYHFNGNNVNASVRRCGGNSADDFIVLTANDPTGAYPFNRYPANEGYTFSDGSKIGYINQDGGLNGATLRDIQPMQMNARILISGMSAAQTSGIVIDGFSPQWSNLESSQAEINSGREAGAICICAEPYNSTTTIIDDVAIKNWRVAPGPKGPQLVFYDVQVNGPYTGQLVLNRLLLQNVTTQQGNPLSSVGAAATQRWLEMSGTQTRWSIGLCAFDACSFDFDASGADYYFNELNPSNVNGEYIKLLSYKNTRFYGATGTWGVVVNKISGSGGANTGKMKAMTFESCHFDSVAAGPHMYPVQLSPSSTLSFKPVIKFSSCTFGRVTCVASISQNAVLMIENCDITQIESGAIIQLVNAAANIDLYWSNNSTNGQPIIGVVAGATINLKKGDETFAVDLSKISAAGSKGSIARSLGTTGGSITDGNLAISDGVNWRQLTAPTTNFL